jgi:hypothetical protein
MNDRLLGRLEARVYLRSFVVVVVEKVRIGRCSGSDFSGCWGASTNSRGIGRTKQIGCRWCSALLYTFGSKRVHTMMVWDEG